MVKPRWPNRLRELREAVGMTQADLAAAVGTSQPGIAAYEAGRKIPTVVTAAKIRKALGLVWLDPLDMPQEPF